MSFKDLVDTALGIEIQTCGEVVTYEFLEDGGSVELNAVFDEDYQAVDVETNSIVSSNMPRFGIRMRDLAHTPSKGDVITTSDDRQFIVKEVQEDGQGGAYLFAHQKESVD